MSRAGSEQLSGDFFAEGCQDMVSEKEGDLPKFRGFRELHGGLPMFWQLVDHVDCLVCDFLGKFKHERLPGAAGWLCEEKDLVGVLCVCRA